MKKRKPKCHPKRKHYANDLCKKCYSKKHYIKNRRKYTELQKKWRKNNPIRVRKLGNKSQQKYCKNHPERVRKILRKYYKTHLEQSKKRGRKSHFKRNYNLTFKQFKKMLKKQDYKCVLCKIKHTKKQRLQVDHNHKTGKIRGLLCASCNKMLGFGYDIVKTFKNAVKYLLIYEKT